MLCYSSILSAIEIYTYIFFLRFRRKFCDKISVTNVLILPFQSYLISVSLCTCVLFNLLIVVFIRLFDHHNILFFDTQLFCNKVSLYRQIVLTVFIVHLRALFLLHTCNFKNLNVLFPKKKISQISLRWNSDDFDDYYRHYINFLDFILYIIIIFEMSHFIVLKFCMF